MKKRMMIVMMSMAIMQQAHGVHTIIRALAKKQMSYKEALAVPVIATIAIACGVGYNDTKQAKAMIQASATQQSQAQQQTATNQTNATGQWSWVNKRPGL